MCNKPDAELIPKGIYCDDCSYWKRIGIIHWKKNPENEYELLCRYGDRCSQCDGCSTPVVRCEFMDFTDFTEETLLWDHVKECGVNND